ncbi:MAG: M20/M25/M40 family metallo-hydrolase [Bacteroidales bacterium]|nr:M20/M25/M40 family metallo-hydrolase [Bacteroidales bacterium]
MDWDFFKELLSFDSTSGQERDVAEWLALRLPGMFPDTNRPVLDVSEVGDGTLNLLLTWGTPRIVFCSHMDTVPPYIPPAAGALPPDASRRSRPVSPRSSDTVSAGPEIITGRGSCDAKGQVFAMVTACRKLAESGCTDFGLLLLAGEETGSWGAKAFAKTDFRAPYLVVGEPTDNCMVSASKGTKSFDLTFTGEAFHSGYPQFGVSAVNLFVEFVNRLKEKDFGIDPVLGETTWNIGLVHSDNPQNILSPQLTCRLYFRTTFVSDEAVSAWMKEAGTPEGGAVTVIPRGGDTPATYWTIPGLVSKPVAFGSDAPHLTNFTHKAICGPGSITVAHRDDEMVLAADLEKAVGQYIELYHATK